MKPILATLLAAVLCAPAAPAAAQTLDEARELYLAQRYDESLHVFMDLLRDDPHNADVLAWLGETLYRMENTTTALGAARKALDVDPCHAPAHNLAAGVYNLEIYLPESRDSVWAHAQRAVECDPNDGNAWLTYWMAGTVRRDTAAELRAARRVNELGFIPGAVMEMGRWMLRSTPRNGVLLLNGDWDWFPITIAQKVEGLRPDVTLVLVGFLEFPWYLKDVAARAGYPVPPEAESGDEWMPADEHAGGLAAAAGRLWAAGTLDGSLRPFTIAGTAAPDPVTDAAWPRWGGAVYTLRPLEEGPENPEDVRVDEEVFAASMRHVDVSRLGGPIVHPTDRSPIRRTGMHPAGVVMLPVVYYGIQAFNEGRMDDARQALAWADALIATGQVNQDRQDFLAELRAQMENGGAP